MLHFSVFLNKVKHNRIRGVLTYFRFRQHGRWRFQLLLIDAAVGLGEGRVLCSTQDPNPSSYLMWLLYSHGFHLNDFEGTVVLNTLFDTIICTKNYRKRKGYFDKSPSSTDRRPFLLEKEADRSNFHCQTTRPRRQNGSRWWQLNPHSFSLKT